MADPVKTRTVAGHLPGQRPDTRTLRTGVYNTPSTVRTGVQELLTEMRPDPLSTGGVSRAHASLCQSIALRQPIGVEPLIGGNFSGDSASERMKPSDVFVLYQSFVSYHGSGQHNR